MKKLLLFAAFAYGVNATQAQTVTTVSGTAGTPGNTVPPNTPIGSATYNSPFGIAVDGANRIWVTEKDGNRVRLIDREASTPSAIVRAGSSSSAAGFVNGVGPNVRFTMPKGIAMDGAGNFFIVDEQNNCIRKMTPYTGLGNSQEVSTYIGINSPTGGYKDTSMALAEFSSPAGIAIAANGNIYISDAQNNCIRKVDTASKEVTTIAGNSTLTGNTNGHGDSAKFINPTGLLMLDENTLLVADQQGGLIRSIDLTTRMVSTYASGSPLHTPTGITKDNQDNIYVSDRNQILKISGGTVSVFAGGSATGSTDAEGTSARFNNIAFITFADGALYVCDAGNHTIRKVTLVTSSVNNISGSVSFNTYPNPVTNQLVIDLNEDEATFSLTDISGRAVLTGKAVKGKNTFETAQLQNGIYILQVATANGSSTSKIIKN